MSAPVLRFEPDVCRDAWNHLAQSASGVEEAAFAYAVRGDGDVSYTVLDWVPVMPEGFSSRSAFHLELTDEARAGAIKRAHDLSASLVELHSHLQPGPAAFSWSDHRGFAEFVPHVWWRLKARPYFAIVVASASFDGLAWMHNPREPVRLGAVAVGSSLLAPTHRSRLTAGWSDDD